MKRYGWYRKHEIDFNDPLVAMIYLGDDTLATIALAEADGWIVICRGDIEQRPPWAKGDSWIEPCIVQPYEQVDILSENGKVVHIQ